MKRIICLFLAFCFMLLTGCTQKSDKQYTSVNFYYRTDPINYESEEGIITVEARRINGPADDYSDLLMQYLNGARKRECISPFPAGTTLEEFSLNDTEAVVVLSSHLSLLTDYELMIACVCLAKTVFDFSDVQSVRISSLNNYLNGEPYIVIDKDSYVMWDHSYMPR